MRDLPKWFVIKKTRAGSLIRYTYHGDRNDVVESGNISGRLRAQVLQEARGRCAMCGETVIQHEISLQIDHRIPLSWGGTDDLSNLQALCVRCNHGKRDYFASVDGELMREVLTKKSVHERIACVLSERLGNSVESGLLSLAADQEDWHKRLRELRYLGWLITPIRKKLPNGRHGTWYRLDERGETPEDMTKTIRAIEARRKREKRNDGD